MTTTTTEVTHRRQHRMPIPGDFRGATLDLTAGDPAAAWSRGGDAFARGGAGRRSTHFHPRAWAAPAEDSPSSDTPVTGQASAAAAGGAAAGAAAKPCGAAAGGTVLQPTAVTLRVAADAAVEPQVFSLVRQGRLAAATVLMRAYRISPDVRMGELTLHGMLERSPAAPKDIAEFRHFLTRNAASAQTLSTPAAATPPKAPEPMKPMNPARTASVEATISRQALREQLIFQEVPPREPWHRPLPATRSKVHDPIEPVSTDAKRSSFRTGLERWAGQDLEAMSTGDAVAPDDDAFEEVQGRSRRHAVKRSVIDPVFRFANAGYDALGRLHTALFVSWVPGKRSGRDPAPRTTHR